MDSTTHPDRSLPSLTKVTTGTRVIIFTNRGKMESGYGEIVKRRLIEAGKDPNSFVLGDLPWGQRIPDSPFIVHRGVFYLQVIVLEEGQSVGYLGDREVNLGDFVRPSRTNQGLSKSDEVVVRAYKCDNIDCLKIVGEVLVEDLPQAILEIARR